MVCLSTGSPSLFSILLYGQHNIREVLCLKSMKLQRRLGLHGITMDLILKEEFPTQGTIKCLDQQNLGQKADK